MSPAFGLNVRTVMSLRVCNWSRDFTRSQSRERDSLGPPPPHGALRYWEHIEDTDADGRLRIPAMHRGGKANAAASGHSLAQVRSLAQFGPRLGPRHTCLMLAHMRAAAAVLTTWQAPVSRPFQALLRARSAQLPPSRPGKTLDSASSGALSDTLAP